MSGDGCMEHIHVSTVISRTSQAVASLSAGGLIPSGSSLSVCKLSMCLLAGLAQGVCCASYAMRLAGR